MKKAKLFMHGGAQAVRLPKDCRFEGTEVYVRRMGEVVVLIPKSDPLAPLVQSLGMFSDDFMDRRDQGKPQKRERL